MGRGETRGDDSFLLLVLDLRSEDLLLDVGERVVGVGLESRKGRRSSLRRRIVDSEFVSVLRKKDEGNGLGSLEEGVMRKEVATHESPGSSSRLSRGSGSERFDHDPSLFDAIWKLVRETRKEGVEDRKTYVDGLLLDSRLGGLLGLWKRERGKRFSIQLERTRSQSQRIRTELTVLFLFLEGFAKDSESSESDLM